MSIDAVSWALNQELPPPEKLVLISLADHHNKETGVCIPGQRSVAKQTCMSVRTVQRHLKQLEKRGLIVRQARFRGEGRGRTSDAYVLQGDNLSAMAIYPKGDGATKATNQDDQGDTVVAPITVREPEDGGNAKFYVRRLVVDLEQNHQTAVDLTADSLGENYLAVARTASQVFDEQTHRGQIIGLTVELLERAFGSMPKQARGMVARLVGTHRPMAVLEAAVRTTGASVGLDPKYADDPLGPVRYLAGILRGGR